MLYVTFVVQFLAAAGFSVFVPFLSLHAEELGTNTSLSVEFWAGMVHTAMATTMMIASPVWGTLSDRYGRKMMVMRSTLGGSIAIVLMGFAQTAEQLALLRGFQGMVTGTVLAANALVAASVPRERAGYAMGLLHGSFVGGIALGPLIGGPVADMFGIHLTFGVAAAILLIAGIIISVGVQEQFTPPVRQKQHHTMMENWHHIFTMPGVLLTYCIRFLGLFGPTMLLPVLPFYVRSLMDNTAQVNTMVGLVSGASYAGGAVGAFFLGGMSDRRGSRYVLLVSLLGAALFYIPGGFVTTVWQLLLLYAFSGIAIGGITPVLNALLAHHTRAGLEGTVYGINHSVSAAARATAPMAGVAIAFWYGDASVFVIIGVVMLVAMLLASLAMVETPAQQQTGS